MRAQLVGKVMEVSGVKRFTPELAALLSKFEVVSLGMGMFFGLRGIVIAAFGVIGLLVSSTQLIRNFSSSEPLTDLEEIAALRSDAPVDVAIFVDFDEAVKVWKVKGRYVCAPVTGHEGRLFFYRKESFLEGEGRDAPIQVKGQAAVKGLLGWELSGTASDIQERFKHAGKELPNDAVILFESEEPSTGLKIWHTVMFVLCALLVMLLVGRTLETIKLLRSPAAVAAKLNRLLGFEEAVPPPLPGGEAGD